MSTLDRYCFAHLFALFEEKMCLSFILSYLQTIGHAKLSWASSGETTQNKKTGKSYSLAVSKFGFTCLWN